MENFIFCAVVSAFRLFSKDKELLIVTLGSIQGKWCDLDAREKVKRKAEQKQRKLAKIGEDYTF